MRRWEIFPGSQAGCCARRPHRTTFGLSFPSTYLSSLTPKTPHTRTYTYLLLRETADASSPHTRCVALPCLCHSLDGPFFLWMALSSPLFPFFPSPFLPFITLGGPFITFLMCPSLSGPCLSPCLIPFLGGPFLFGWPLPLLPLLGWPLPLGLPLPLPLPPPPTETVYRKKALFSVGVTSTRQQIAKDMSWSEPLSRVASVRLADLELGDRNANIRRQLLVQPQRE